MVGSPSRVAVGSPSRAAGPAIDRPTGARQAKKQKNPKEGVSKRRRKRKNKGKRARRSPSQSSSSTTSSDSPSSGDEADSADSAGKWDLLNDVWPMETRPSKLQIKEYVEKLSWETLNALQDRYERAAEKKGVGAAIFGRDRKLKKVSFGPKTDDGFTKLHPAR